MAAHYSFLLLKNKKISELSSLICCLVSNVKVLENRIDEIERKNQSTVQEKSLKSEEGTTHSFLKPHHGLENDFIEGEKEREQNESNNNTSEDSGVPENKENCSSFGKQEPSVLKTPKLLKTQVSSSQFCLYVM